MGFIFVLLYGCGVTDSKNYITNNYPSSACYYNCPKNQSSTIDQDNKFHIEVQTTGKISQAFYNLSAKDIEQRPIVLRKIRKIKGILNGSKAYIKNDQNKQNIETGNKYSEIVAIPLANQTSFLSPPLPIIRSSLNVDETFSINVLEGITYAIVINPNALYDMPPIYLPKNNFKKGLLKIKADNTPPIFKGRLNKRHNEHFLKNFYEHFEAYLLQGTRLVSTKSALNDSGEFSLKISDPLFASFNNLPLFLIIEPKEPHTIYPTIKRKVTKAEIKNNAEIKQIYMGPLKKPLSAKFMVFGCNGAPAQNASLLLRRQQINSETNIQRELDQDGKVVFEKIFPGSYELAIMPPFDSKSAIKVIRDFVIRDEESEQIIIHLEKRKPMFAHVKDKKGNPIENAQVEFSRIGQIGSIASENIFEDFLFKFTAITNEDGQICHRNFGFQTTKSAKCEALLLDEGRYLTQVMPPKGEKLGYGYKLFDFPHEKKLTITLNPPKTIKGQLVNYDQKNPIENAFITIYLAEKAMPSKVIGDGITDLNGEFQIFITLP